MVLSSKSFISELYSYRAVLNRLVQQQLTLRYRRTALGYFWTLINPLLMMSVMALVFSSLYKTDLKTFALFLFAGMIPWNFFSALVAQSCTSFINNEGLIKKIYLPKLIFPFSLSIALLIDSILSFLALLIIIFILGGQIGMSIIFIPYAFAALWVFTLGVGLVISVFSVFFRDLQHIVVIGLQGLFFLSPILYKSDALSGPIKWLVNLNPISIFIELFRAPLLFNLMPDTTIIATSLMLAIISLLIGLFVFFKWQKSIVFRL
jgi:ABC-type polysaccharide/polyol phosphate export permease